MNSKLRASIKKGMVSADDKRTPKEAGPSENYEDAHVRQKSSFQFMASEESATNDGNADEENEINHIKYRKLETEVCLLREEMLSLGSEVTFLLSRFREVRLLRHRITCLEEKQEEVHLSHNIDANNNGNKNENDKRGSTSRASPSGRSISRPEGTEKDDRDVGERMEAKGGIIHATTFDDTSLRYERNSTNEGGTTRKRRRISNVAKLKAVTPIPTNSERQDEIRTKSQVASSGSQNRRQDQLTDSVCSSSTKTMVMRNHGETSNEDTRLSQQMYRKSDLNYVSKDQVMQVFDLIFL